MVQQEYTVMPPGGNGYRIVVEIQDEPIVASRGGRSLALDAAWVRREADAFLERNKDYPGLASYFSGFLKGLHTIGILDVMETIAILSEVSPQPPESDKEKEAEGPQPLWAVWGRI